MIIKVDEDSMGRMLGVPAAQIPESVLAEYELRLRLFHCDGNSGPLGTIGVIDMLRSMKLGKIRPDKPPVAVDWSLVPMNGTIRVMARVAGDNGHEKWVSGVYVGQVGVGSLAVRLDGSVYVHEIRRDAVRIARDGPMEPGSPEDVPEEPIESSSPEESPLVAEPWASLSYGQPLMVQDGDDHKKGVFQGFAYGEILVVLDGELTSRPFSPESVTCLEDPSQVTAGK